MQLTVMNEIEEDLIEGQGEGPYKITIIDYLECPIDSVYENKTFSATDAIGIAKSESETILHLIENINTEEIEYIVYGEEVFERM